MASAIARALDSSYELEIIGRNPLKAKSFIEKNELKNAVALESNQKINVENKIVLLAQKPYGLTSFNYVGKAKIVFSVLAGIKISTIEYSIESSSYVRLMPNTAANVGLSSTAVYIDSRNEAESFKAEVKEIIESFGNAVFLNNENLIDSAIATNGSATAFVALFAQALIDSGVREGLSRKDSTKLVTQTIKGVAKMLESNSPQEIIESVTTPGGTTIEGLSVLESGAFKGLVMAAAHASVEKCKK